MIQKLEDLLDFFESNLCEKNLVQLKNLRKSKDSIDPQEFLLWAQKSHNLKIVSYDIPSSILKNSKLYDIKIDSRGPDDKVYDKNEELRLKVARGNSILEINENGKIYYKLVIYALRKFTGGLGDEDDLDRNSNDWKNYFIRDYSYVSQVMSLQKANGEAAHFSCSWIENQFLLCAGSKNVHLVFKDKNDLINFSGPRFSYAKLISQAILNFLDKLDSSLKVRLLSFLCIFNLTVVFEILNPETQHVEDLSFLTEPMLMFITFTPNTIDSQPSSLCSMTPDCAIQIANLFKFNTVKMELIDKSEIENHLNKVRKGYGYEGVVLYFLDSESNVIGLLKKKTTWYIILRALREKLRFYMSAKSNGSLFDLEDKVKSRLKSIQNWIGFDDKELKEWLSLSLQFCRWFDEKFKKNSISKDDLSNKFPLLWSKFLAETSLSDKIEITINRNENSSIEKLNDNLENFTIS